MNLYVKILKQEHGTFYVAKRDGVKLGVFASIDEALERMALEKPLPPKLKCPVNIWQSKKFYCRGLLRHEPVTHSVSANHANKPMSG